MSGPVHTVGKQTLVIEAPDEETARALMARIGDVHRRTMVPIIGRVLDELAVTGWHFELAKIDIDLGTLPLTRFEEVLGERLHGELRRVLEEALRRARERPSPEERVVREEASRLALLDHYLVHGTLPYRAPAESAFSCEALVLELVAADPEGVARMVRRRGDRRAVLERLTLRLGAAALGRLLRAMDPENAALVVAYLLDLGEIHRARPLVALSEERFVRLAWLIALVYVAREPGSQFNRKSFVLSLIEGLAGSERLESRDVLRALRSGLTEAERRGPLGSSLPALLLEIATDLEWEEVHEGPGDTADSSLVEAPEAGASPLAILEYALLRGVMPVSTTQRAPRPVEALVLDLIGGHPDGLRRLLRQHGRDRWVLERLVRALTDPSIDRLLHALDPDSAGLIMACVLDTQEACRAASAYAFRGDTFGRLLWVLALAFLVRDDGSQFNRKGFVRALLGGMAESEGIAYHDVLSIVRLGLAETARRQPLRSSLPGVLDELVRDLDAATWEDDGIRRAGDPTAADRGPTLQEAVLAFLLGGRGALATSPLRGSSPVGSFSVEAVLAELHRMLDAPPDGFVAFVRRHVAEEGVRARWADVLSDSALVQVAAISAPRNHRSLVDAAVVLASAWTADAPSGRHAAEERRAFWDAFLGILSRSAGAELSIPQLTRALCQHFAARSRAATGGEGGSAAPGETFLEHATRGAAEAGNAGLSAALQGARSDLLALWTVGAVRARPEGSARPVGPAAPRGERSRRHPWRTFGETAFTCGGEDTADDLAGEAVFIDNAGLVLVGAFLPRLFRDLGMLSEDGRGRLRMRDWDAASRGVHLLQHLVDGRTAAPEPTLVLNKVLCGVATGTPVAPAIELTEAELAAGEQLQRAIIGNWTRIANTSIAGLQETFLRREGKLSLSDDRFLLRVQRKTVDVLVDEIPWSISVLHQPWMPVPLYVTW